MAMNSGLKIQSIKWHKIDVDNPETWPDESKDVLLWRRRYGCKNNMQARIVHRDMNYWYRDFDDEFELELRDNQLWAEIPMPPDCLIKGK